MLERLSGDIFLSRREQFVQAARRGKKVQGECWLLRARRTRQPGARLGISVSKKFIRGAVSRNRLRRVIRESFRQQWRATLPPMDVILSLHKKPENEQSARRECQQLLVAAAKL